MKCDNCNKPATVHLTEIKNGKKIEKHLCEQCAAQNEGLPVKSHTPINELLTNFVMAHSRPAERKPARPASMRHHLGGVPPERAARAASTITRCSRRT